MLNVKSYRLRFQQLLLSLPGVVLLIIFILPLHKIQAQSVKVIDSISGQELPYATVTFDRGGLYSDSNGQFLLDGINAQKIRITYLGYEDFMLNPNTYKNPTVRMVPKSMELNEVLLSNRTERVKLDFLRKTKFFGYFPLQNGHEVFIRIIPDEINANSNIEAVYFSFASIEKHSYREKSPIGHKVRVNIYNHLDEKIYSDIIEIDTDEQEIKVILPEKEIQFYEDGIAFGIEMLESVRNGGNEQSTLNIELTGKTTKAFSAQTFYKYIFNEEEGLIPFNTIIKDPSGKKYRRNVNIALDLIRDEKTGK